MAPGQGGGQGSAARVILARSPRLSRVSASFRRAAIWAADEHRHAGGGKLDGQRHAVQAVANLGDGGGVVADEREARRGRRGTFDEQPHRGDRRQRPHTWDVRGIRQRQRRGAPGDLAFDPDRLAAGRQERDPGTSSQQPADHPAHASTRCSQLSSTISRCRSRSWDTRPSTSLPCAGSWSRSAPANSATISSPSASAPNSTSTAPSA